MGWPHASVVPRPAIKVLVKLLANKEVNLLTLRRSTTLIEITSTKFTFIGKLIDAEYPAYERLVLASTDNTAIVDRVALAQAVARIAAVTSDDGRLPLVGLTWKAPHAGRTDRVSSESVRLTDGHMCRKLTQIFQRCSIGNPAKFDRAISKIDERGLVRHRNGGYPCGLSRQQIRQTWIDLEVMPTMSSLRRSRSPTRSRGWPGP
jgi:hypothetical protein